MMLWRITTPLILISLVGCDDGSTNAGTGAGGTGGAASSVGGGSSMGGGSTGGAASQGGVASTTGPLVTATITVSGEHPKPVSPLFFGQNYWSWVPAWGDPVAFVEAQTKDLGLNLLRAGGANNDRQNPAPFSFEEVDGFVAFAKSVGAEPLLQVPMIKNLYGTAATAQDAAELVTHVNVTQGYGVKYFSIGNEPDLYTEQSLKPTEYDAKSYCSTYAEFAAAMKAVDPSIKIVGPELSWKYQGANDWLTPFLQDCGSATDIVTVHRYPLSPTACTEAAAYADADQYRWIIGRLKAIATATGQGDKPLAITEANITWDGDPAKSTMAASPGTFPAALWLADNIGVSLEEQLYNVSYWSLSEGWTLGFFAASTPRPAYHVLRLFSNGFGSEVLTVTGAPTGASVYAGRDAASAKTTLFVVNKTKSPLDLSVNFAAMGRSAAAKLAVQPISIQMAVLPDDGSAAAITDYDASMSAPVSR